MARTVEELSDYIFEIHYVPGHLNSAADALSRLSSQLPPYNDVNVEPCMPTGLVLDGLPTPGDGDSLFISLHRSLTGLSICRSVPGNEHELRVLLVDDLLTHSSKYNIHLNRDSRKNLRLMRCPGQLPSLDVLLSVSRLFLVKVFVYFWSTDPVIYQVEDYPQVIHLQCVSGIHFNPLIEVRNYLPPNVQQCTINSVLTNENHVLALNVNPNDDINDKHPVEDELLVVNNCKMCSHSVSRLPMIMITVNDYDVCCVLDTGSEISLVSMSALEKLGIDYQEKIVNEHVCDVIGFSGVKTAIKQTIELSLTIGPYVMPDCYQFAIVEDDVLPHCFLFGLDFLSEHEIDIDLGGGYCRRNTEIISVLVVLDWREHISRMSLMTARVENPQSHQLISNIVNGDFRFEIQGTSSTVSGLSLLMENDVIKQLQARCPIIRLLLKSVSRDAHPKQWPDKN